MSRAPAWAAAARQSLRPPAPASSRIPREISGRSAGASASTTCGGGSSRFWSGRPGRPADERVAALVADVYRPYAAFWAGYLGDETAFAQWALANEGALWNLVAPQLRTRERAVIERFAAARSRPLPGGPGKIGYFLGYRIADAYVRRHGPESWRNLFALPYARALEESGYAPTARRAP
ncbi:MAG: hypothetical protein ABR499_15445 [Gemmatimonadaceae bacterium]